MTDVINKLASKKLKDGINKLMNDSKQFERTGEFELNPENVIASTNTSYTTNRITKKEKEDYLKILDEIKKYRAMQEVNSKSMQAKKDYIDNLIYWN